MRAIPLILGVVALLGPAIASAQIPGPETYTGDFWTRPRLTGDWGGFRDQMGKRGVTLDVDWLQTFQGVVTGGREQDSGYWGLVEYTLRFDSQKLGLWPGAFLNVSAMSSYGATAIKDTGALVPVNTAGILPSVQPDEPATALMELTFLQFLAPWFGVGVGKFNGLAADANAFAHNFRTQFMNLGLSLNSVAILAPLSAYGGSLIFVPTEGALVTVAALDPDGTPRDNGLAHIFENGVLLDVEARFTIRPFGLVGHQLLGGIWSNKTRTDLRQDPGNIATQLLENQFPRLSDPGPVLRRIIDRFFPELDQPTGPLKTRDETWAIYYNFDQYLWSPAGAPDRGIGVFFRFGVSDGKVNPIKYAFNVGISGNGIVPGRPDDSFGIGWSRVNLSDDLFAPVRDRLGLGHDHEDAIELYYNFVIAKSINLSLDLQIVEPVLQKTSTPSGALKGLDTAVVGGLRAYVRF